MQATRDTRVYGLQSAEQATRNKQVTSWPSRPRTSRLFATTSIIAVMVRLVLVALVMSLATVLRAQTPQPFPRAVGAQPPRTAPASPAAQVPATAPPPVVAGPADVSTGAQGAKVDPNAPTAETLGVPVYPGAQFFASYDAGRGQRYYLFGTTASFAELVGYYRTQIGDKGDLVFEDPPTHMFTGGKLGPFRDRTMAFPPSVTVKDWTSGGSPGYPNPKIGAQPQRFPTVIMIVPAPPGTPAPR